MDNQHTLIKGYRDLSQEEIDEMNNIKDIGNLLDSAINALTAYDHIDKRWLSIGKTHLQQGIMAVVRSIAQPETF